MSDFITRLHEVLEESHRQKDLQKAADTNRQIRFIENVVTVISTRLHIAAEMIVILDHSTAGNTVLLQIDGVFFRLMQTRSNINRKFETSNYGLYITNFSIANGFEWKDMFICALPNLDIETLAEEVFSLFNLEQLILVTADTQAYYGSNDKRILVDRVLMSKFETDRVVRLRELNASSVSSCRWVYQIGHRVIAYYYRDFNTRDHRTDHYRGNISVLGYTYKDTANKRVCYETRANTSFQSSISVDISATVRSNPNIVFAAAEVMQVLGLEPIVARAKEDSLTETA